MLVESLWNFVAFLLTVLWIIFRHLNVFYAILVMEMKFSKISHMYKGIGKAH